MKILQLISLLIIVSACSSLEKAEYVYTSDNLKIKAISENVFMHVSYLNTNDFGKVECNGMIYFNDGEAIVFDTPTNDSASAELIKWIQVKKGTKINAVVATHFHEDCLGGLQQFHASGIKSFANKKTIRMARINDAKELPQNGFDDWMKFDIGDKPVFAIFYGAGHTADNVVGYIPNEETLFGGCLIKSMNADKGFLGDANVAEWPITVSTIKEKLPDINVVIPGHGNYGGKELLDYTIQLFQEK